MAEAAITLLVERGMRGLTHRAVDEAAGLPLGSTSNLARTRAALLALTLARLTALEEGYFTAIPQSSGGADASVGGVSASIGDLSSDRGAAASGREAGASGGGVGGPGELADLMAGLLHRQLTDGRRTTLARYELALEATRRPELREVYDQAGRRFREVAIAVLAAAGSRDPDRHGKQLVAFGEGVLFDAIAGAGAVPTLEELRSGMRELLRGMLS
ncbi:TetR/AcrR family transcriptional regulator [Sphaerisporangium perillae]|uniref:TetR/AcrR family transcriptional regulator n=1 Tax=Sphaerisporangium perillae TaxID=2935860 RepID=UPI0027E08296|nr:TetR/AcrR family transcriptional regulator [Sphaerisporangium perillae]